MTIQKRKRLFREPPSKPQYRINEAIRISPVRVIDEDGNQIGVISIEEARERARSSGLDLVEIAPQARPVVCKIMDHGRYLYEQEKKAKEARKQQHQIEIKEVKFRPNIDDHDFETKANMAKRFLEKGKHVKVTIMFRRREMRRPENGYEILARVKEFLADVAEVERDAPPRLESRDLSMVLKKRG